MRAQLCVMSNGNLEMAMNPEKGETGAEGDTPVRTKYGRNNCVIECNLFPPQKGTSGGHR